MFELQGGLSNRLRALWSAHAFALRHRRSVVVLWPINSELGCAHQDLFTLDSPVKLISFHQARPWQNLALRLSRLLFSSLRFGLNSPKEAGQAWGRPARFAPRWMPFQWIQTCAEFENIESISAPFSPLPNLQRQAAARLVKARAAGGLLVGVHIRRTDHRHSILCSATDAFVAAMRDQLIREPATRFLLCTDDPSEVEPLRVIFGDRLIWYPPRCFDRSLQQSATDALVDFLTLSGCSLIFCSYLSSFSLLSARMGDVPYMVIGNPDFSSV